MKTSFAAGAVSLGFGLLCSFPVLASEPATHEVTVPSPGNSVTLEWTGEALPGASAVPGTINLLGSSLGGAPAVLGCAPAGPDDSHAITISVPEGFYEAGNTVSADFVVEWEPGETVEGLFADPDLGFSVYEGTVNLMGYSDGGEPSETVGVSNPVAGTYTAIVCPFTSSRITPYRGRLTLTTHEPKACVVAKSATIANAVGGGPSGSADISGLANFDTFFAETRGFAYGVPTHDAGRLQSPVYDRALGLPTFLWARTDAQVPAVGALNERDLLVERARAHLRNEAKPLRLTAQAIDEARVFDAQFNGEGPAVVRFRQQVDGIEVFQRSLNVLLNREHRPMAVSGYFAPKAQPLGGFSTGARAAIAASWATLGGSLDPSTLSLAETRGAWQRFGGPQVAGSHELQREPRARKVWYARAGGLEPAWQVELFANARSNGQLIAYSFVVSARNNAVLHRDNLKHEAAYSYRVFADKNGNHQPYDSPLGNAYVPFPGLVVRKGIEAQLVTLEHAGIRTGDPWLADDATTTDGNNVRACIDTYDHPVDSLVNLGEIGGVRQNDCLAPIEPGPALTGDRTFDHAIETDEDPSHPNAKDAAAVNLFYMINWLHDWWYNHGFDEAAGNAQALNFGRGGEEGDPIIGHGQDGSGSNNANMATPADGSSPVMQQYLFDGKAPKGEVRTVAPAGDPIYWVGAAFGPQEYDVEPTAVALADDGVGEPGDGCGEPVPVLDEALAAVHENDPGTPLPGPLTYQPVPAPPQASLVGKIALIDRGNCNSGAKVKFAMASGAVAMIVINNTDAPPTIMTSDQPVYATAVGPRAAHDAVYNIPSVMIPKADGERIKALLASGEVTMSMTRQPTVKLDGTLDNTIIAHEFFHYVHHRLTDSTSAQTDAMSEGWGDINGFMVSLRDEDVNVTGNDRFQGAYAVAGYVFNDFFKGIRRKPYTTDFALNDFTFKEIQNDTGAHAAGEVWAEMVYECYAGILNGPGSYAHSRSRMQDYIIAGLKMTPANATYVEARDAVMAAALATNLNDYAACGKGFARRGIGLRAVAPSRSSTSFEGLVEDYTPFVCGKRGEIPTDVGNSSSPVVGGTGLFFLLPLLGAVAVRRRRGR